MGLSTVVPRSFISIGAFSVTPKASASGSVASVGGDFLFAGSSGFLIPLLPTDFLRVAAGVWCLCLCF